MTTPEVASSVLRSIHEIYTADNLLYFKYSMKIWNVFDEMGKFIISEFFLTQLCVISSGSRMIYNVLEILKDIYINSLSKEDEYIKNNFNIFQDSKLLERLLIFVSKLLKSSRNTEGINSLPSPQKHLIDEKNVFDFLEQLHCQIKTLPSCNIYHEYLLKFLKYDLSDLHSEAHCRRVLEILENFYNSKSKSDLNLSDLVINFIKESSYICCLRNKNEYVSVLIKNNKLPNQLWHFTIIKVISILKSIICNNINYDNIDQEESKERTIFDVWEATISCFETVFKQSEGGYKNINRTLIEDLLSSCQEMEVEIINFIVNDLLPHSLKIPKDKQVKLLGLLDLGCNFDHSNSSSNSSNSSSISRVCIDNLFDLCKYKDEETLKKDVEDKFDEYVKIKIKIAKMSTPILIRRCKEILKSFYDDEIKQGSMPLMRSRIEDMKYILINLKKIDVYPNYHLIDEVSNNNENNIKESSIFDSVMKSKKSHLFSLMSFLSEFITCKDPEIKLIVKDIFKIITAEIGMK